MRLRQLAVASLALGALATIAAPARTQASDRLEAARYFDQLGVRAYAEGRWADAKVYFQEAYENGGPPSELWNIAKCELQSSDARAAAKHLESYLERDDLPADDRREAEKLLSEIKKRPSQLSVASSPAGVTVRVDDHVVGITPLTTTLAPGVHDLYLEDATGRSFDRSITAEYGVAIAIGADLGEGAAANGPRPPPPPRRPVKRFAIELFPVGISFAVRGDAPLSPFISPSISVTYTILAGRRALFGAGLRFALAFERWTTSPGTPNVATGCNLPNDYGATELMAHPFLFGAVRVGSVVDLGLRAGFGLSGLASPSELGGDYFEPGCDVKTGLRGDFFGAVDVSFRFNALRILLQPIAVDLHSGYGGARSTPFDTTGLWTRIGVNLGAAVDF